MPSKTKNTKFPEKKADVKKYVVEEKEDGNEKELPTEAKSSEVRIEIDDIAPEINENKATETIEKPVVKASDNSNTEDTLKSEEEKDTLASTNVTSFSLLDSDKKEVTKENTMENTEKEVKEEVLATPKPEATETRSSNEEINKWIENYDEKEGEVKKKGQGFFKIFLIILTVLSLFAVIAGGFYLYQKNLSNKGTQKEETNEAIVTETPSASPTQAPETTKLDYSKYSLQIMNGSGVPGEAGKAKDLLTDYNFKSVVTGNASSYGFEQTVISLKEGIPDQVFTDLSKSLNSTYDVKSTKEVLNDSSNFDIVVTVGVRK
jgi:LytR cell envelope-related transcriptional attenuator